MPEKIVHGIFGKVQFKSEGFALQVFETIAVICVLRAADMYLKHEKACLKAVKNSVHLNNRHSIIHKLQLPSTLKFVIITFAARRKTKHAYDKN